jgi:hypothetical protein
MLETPDGDEITEELLGTIELLTDDKTLDFELAGELETLGTWLDPGGKQEETMLIAAKHQVRKPPTPVQDMFTVPGGLCGPNVSMPPEPIKPVAMALAVWLELG